jgi:DNA polymerase I-like protein with 3'-5' exonuclease and polymerase domains/uracil-DNA glycosylase
MSNCQRPKFCGDCPIAGVTCGYVPLAQGYGTQLFVGEAAGEEEALASKPFVGGAGTWLNSMLRAAKINRGSISIVNCLGCRPPSNVFPTEPNWPEAVQAFWTEEAEKLRRRKDYAAYEAALAELPSKTSTRADGFAAVEHCRVCHLMPAVDGRKWSRIVALGDKALEALTSRKGILIWRGSPLPLKHRTADGPQVVPTLHPAYLMRNAGLFSVAVGDLRRQPTIPPEYYNLYPSLADVRAFNATTFAFDFEWDAWGQITLCGLCDRYHHAIVVPWEPPFVDELRRIFENAKILIGHNIVGADTRHFERLGWRVNAELVDTMLIQHLVQPDMKHDLGFVASVFSSKVFWKGKGEETEDAEGNVLPAGAQWRTWDRSDALPREFGGYGGCASADEAYRLYNARDTEGSFQCAGPLQATLRKYDMERVYRLVSVPVAYICRDITDIGLRIDNSRVKDIRVDLEKQIAELEVKLPDGLAPYDEPVIKQVEAPPDTYKPKTRKCKGKRKLGTLHAPVEVTFTTPGYEHCPVCNEWLHSGKLAKLKRIKIQAFERVVPWNSSQQVLAYARAIGCEDKLNHKTKRVTADKSARKSWGRHHTEFTLVDTLKKLVTQRNSFAKPGLLETSRVYFNLLVHGTSEGRLSSSGKRRGIDPNIQNQPKVIRKIFVPDHPGWGILSADIVQGENMLTAWLAQDHERLERLRTPGYDEHSDMAHLFFNKPIELVSKGGVEEHLRAPGKVVNHGKNYGLGVETARMYLAEEGYNYTVADIREMFEIWAKRNTRTAQWQDEVVELVRRQGYLCNPFGRRRWFQCNPPETRALKADLTWTPMGDLKIGDELIGFDEHLDHPKLRRSIVTCVNPFETDIYELETDKGVVRATARHGWATRLQVKGGRGGKFLHRWISTEYLRPGDKIIYFAPPWRTEPSRDAVWLAGILDGEGHLDSRWKRGIVAFSQNPGIILDKAINIANELGLRTTEPRHVGTREVRGVRLYANSPRSALEIIGRLRPERFLQKAPQLWENKPAFDYLSYGEVATVTSIRHVGKNEVIAIGTSTETLMVEGMYSHNSRDYATKSLAFLPASTLADVVLRMMIALYPERFANEIAELGLKATYALPAPWRLAIQVHDELVAMGPHEGRFDVARGLRAIMTQPWDELDGFALGVEIKYSTDSWGACKLLRLDDQQGLLAA